MLQPRHLLLGEHDAGAVRQARDHLAGLDQHLVDRFLPLDADLRLDLAALLVAEVADLEQAVDEEPQSGLRRQPPRGRVRRKIKPSCSRSAITLRIEAGDSVIGSTRERLREPTGSPVDK